MGENSKRTNLRRFNRRGGTTADIGGECGWCVETRTSPRTLLLFVLLVSCSWDVLTGLQIDTATRESASGKFMSYDGTVLQW